MIIKVTYQESKKDGFNGYFALRLFVIIWNYFSKVIEIEPLQLVVWIQFMRQTQNRRYLETKNIWLRSFL